MSYYHQLFHIWVATTPLTTNTFSTNNFKMASLHNNFFLAPSSVWEGSPAMTRSFESSVTDSESQASLHPNLLVKRLRESGILPSPHAVQILMALQVSPSSSSAVHPSPSSPSGSYLSPYRVQPLLISLPQGQSQHSSPPLLLSLSRRSLNAALAINKPSECLIPS